MRIEHIEATEVVVPAHPGSINSPGLERPLHKIASKGHAAWSRQFDEVPKLILRVHWTDGLVGLGECYRDHDWDRVDAIAGRLVGLEMDELVLQRLPIPRCREHDGFECALWDSYAKARGMPLVDLLGGPVRPRVLVGAWSGHRRTEDVGPLAERFASQGFTSLKLKCDLDDDVVGWCRAIADAAPDMRVILDPNERWERSAEARTRLAGLAEVGNVLCLEDPIPRWMLDEYRDLRRSSAVPIALHVSLPYAEHGQRIQDAIQAIQQRAVDGFNFNAGLDVFRRLDAIADAAGLPCWHGSELDLGILEAAYLHACAAAPSCRWPSDVFGRLIRTHDLLATPLGIEPPYADVPTGPGLGVELDEDAVRAHTIQERAYDR